MSFLERTVASVCILQFEEGFKFHDMSYFFVLENNDI
jgi:hypothetical protein